MNESKGFKAINSDQELPSLDRINYLLAIGIDNYQHVKKLNNCVHDAQTFSKVLIEEYDFEAKNVRELYDLNASRAEILRSLKEISRDLNSTYNLIIYFAGHGLYDADTQMGFLVPVDGRQEEEWSLIFNSQIRDYIKACKAHHILLIVDSCFSGDLILHSRETKVVEAATEAYADKVNHMPSRWGLAAGRIEKVSDGISGNHSPFNDSLITFLTTQRANRFAVSELINYVGKITTYNSEQTPIGGILDKSGHKGGEFVFQKRTFGEKKTTLIPSENFNSLKEIVSENTSQPRQVGSHLNILNSFWVIGIVAALSFPILYFLLSINSGINKETLDKDESITLTPTEVTELKEFEKNDSDGDDKPWMNRYDSVELSKHSTVMIVHKDGKRGYVDPVGNEIIKPQFDRAWEFGKEHENLAKVLSGDQYYFINKKGEKVKLAAYKTVDKSSTNWRPMPLPLSKQEALSELDRLMVAIKGGKFMMKSEQVDTRENLEYEVSLDPYELGKYEVTQAQWNAIMNTNPSIFSDCYNCPVENISWDDAQKFIYLISELSGTNFRLPTEAEWEFAAKSNLEDYHRYSGTDSKENLHKYANFCDVRCVFAKDIQDQDDGFENTAPVGSYFPNKNGLHDMSGNVWEWCSDYFGKYPNKFAHNPQGPNFGSSKVVRGGSYNYSPEYCAATSRSNYPPYVRKNFIGLRLAR